jgi:hypothetical protein
MQTSWRVVVFRTLDDGSKVVSNICEPKDQACDRLEYIDFLYECGFIGDHDDYVIVTK